MLLGTPDSELPYSACDNHFLLLDLLAPWLPSFPPLLPLEDFAELPEVSPPLELPDFPELPLPPWRQVSIPIQP